jgi:hypothetical protein
MRILATDPVLAKISVLDITLLDIEEAVFWLDAPPIEDKRSVHRTSPPTVWFVAPTSEDRLLFIAGIWDEEDEAFIVRTARDATDQDMRRWNNGKW